MNLNEGWQAFLFVAGIALLSSCIATGIVKYKTSHNAWEYTKNKYRFRDITFDMFVTGYLLAPSSRDLFEDYVMFEHTSMAFQTYSDYKKYIKFRAEKIMIDEKRAADKAMNGVVQKLFDLYIQKEDKDKHD